MHRKYTENHDLRTGSVTEQETNWYKKKKTNGERANLKFDG